MLTFCIDKAFLCNNGEVYQQTVGIPMGLNASPQIAQLVYAHYELLFVKRLAISHFEHPDAPFLGINDKDIRLAVLTSFLNGARMLDDICLAIHPFWDSKPGSGTTVTQLVSASDHSQ